MRTVFAFVVASSIACGAAREPPAVAPREPPGASSPSETASAAPVASTSTSTTRPPLFDERREEAILACKRKECWPRGKGCFDACYEYNHPFNPQGHERCNENCRRSYGLDACEAKCERTTK